MLGLYPNFVPKFCKQYIYLSEIIQNSLKQFKKEVEEKSFPSNKYSYSIKVEELEKAFPDFLSFIELPKNQELQENKSISFIKSNDNKKTITIIGGGAMGSLIGGKIAATGNYNVWMLSSWKEHVNKINQEGLKIKNLNKSIEYIKLNATSNVEEIINKNGKVDLAIILVKSPKTKQAAENAVKLIDPSKGFILSLQNGLGNKEIISNILGDESRVIQGITNHGSYILESGLVVHTGKGSTTISFNDIYSEKIKEITEILSRSGIDCEITTNLDSMLWGKLIINAGINPLTALLRVKNGVIASSEFCRKILSKIVQEGVNVAIKRGKNFL